jgi:hypothetical protein
VIAFASFLACSTPTLSPPKECPTFPPQLTAEFRVQLSNPYRVAGRTRIGADVPEDDEVSGYCLRAGRSAYGPLGTFRVYLGASCVGDWEGR